MKIFMTFTIFLQVLSLFAQDISITVTQNNLALVKESRSIKIKKGNHSLNIMDLPALLDPTSVNFFFSDQTIKLHEYYFAFDLDNIQTMLEKSIGKSLRIIHPDLGTIQGKLISVQPDILVIQTSDGELRVITNYGENQFIIEKSDSQDALVIEPTIFCSLESNSDANDKTEISYLTNGMNWNMQYTAIVDDDEENVSLSPRAVISNMSGKTYQDSRLLLLAGDINRQQMLSGSAAKSRAMEMADMVTIAAESDFQESESFEYHSYRLKRDITLENNQQKVLPLYPTLKTTISKIYTYHYQKDPTSVSVVISMLNSKDKGLGYPFPAGLVRIQKQDDDTLIILGEDNIPHTPVGEEIKLKIGQAFDILVERKVLDRKREGKNTEKMKISIEFRNRKNENIEIRVTEPIIRQYDYRILSSNIEIYKKEAKQIEFIVPVKANQTNTLVYEIIYNW